MWVTVYGFREKHSTEHAILDIINRIQSNLVRKSVLFFSSEYLLILAKLLTLSITISYQVNCTTMVSEEYIINEWFASYLKGRLQTTRIKSYISRKQKTLCGAPQGSFLGPLLFLIYINDICKSSKVLRSSLNRLLVKVSNWLIANKLTLNIKKSNFVIFRPHHWKKINYKPVIKQFDNNLQQWISLENKEYIKYLGVLIDYNLSWKQHLAYISLKISKVITMISRYFVPVKILINLYRSLKQQYLSYGIVAWGRAEKIYINKLLVLQKRALRLTHFADRRQHAVPLFVSSNFLPIQMIYFKSTACLMHDINNKTSPILIQKLFPKADTIHNYTTRSAVNWNYFVKSSILELQKTSFSRSGAVVGTVYQQRCVIKIIKIGTFQEWDIHAWNW